jgi:hypothetical protein
VGAPKQGFRARLPPILKLSTRYQTGWNVTKCHACHAKRHDNLLGNLRRRGFAASPKDTAKAQENQRLQTRRVGAPKPAFRARQFSHFVASKPTLSEHTLNPQTPRVKRETLLRIREKGCGGMAPDRHTKLAPKTKAWFPSLPMHFAHRIWGKLHSHHSQVRFFFLNTAEKKILKTTRTGPAMFVAL